MVCVLRYGVGEGFMAEFTDGSQTGFTEIRWFVMPADMVLLPDAGDIFGGAWEHGARTLLVG